jgi:hypothetical protein
MRFSCHPVDASFFDTAPMRFKNVVDLDARLAEVFAIFEDGESRPKWFSGITWGTSAALESVSASWGRNPV